MAYVSPHAGDPRLFEHDSGFFGGLCLTDDVSNALPIPEGDLLAELPRTGGSIVATTRFGLVSGITGVTETPAARSCDPPRFRPGNLKFCAQEIEFGCMSFATGIFDIKRDGLAQACATINVQTYGGGFDSTGNWIPDLGGNTGQDPMLSSPANKLLYELYLGMHEVWSPLGWTGDGTQLDPTFVEPIGLCNQIITGHVDAQTGDPCPAADSIIYDFAGEDVCEMAAQSVATVKRMWRSLLARDAAFKMGVVVRVARMRRGLFHQLTDVWPCQEIAKCAAAPLFSADGSPIRTSMDTQALRDAMRSGLYLPVDGMRIPVVLDETIPEMDMGGGVWESPIKFLPLTYRNGRPATVVDWRDWNSPLGLGDPATQQLIGDAIDYAVLGGGRFLFIRYMTGVGCMEAAIYTCVRPLLLTPQIAGSIERMAYTYDSYDRVQTDRTASDWVDGGGLVSRP